MQIYPVILLSLTVYLVAEQAKAQQAHPNAPAETAQLDVLLGEWDLVTRDIQPDGTYKTGRATATVYYILDGYAIQDDFRQLNDKGEVIFRGTSIRSFNPRAKKWHIVWVMPTLAGVADIEAVYEEGEFRTTGKGYDDYGEFLERGGYYNISEDHYSFKIDRSYNGGQTWISPFGTIEATRVK